MRETVTYRHVFGARLGGPLAFSSHPSAQDVCDYNYAVNGRAGNKGGYTIRIDHEEQTMVLSLCSFKDNFSRKRGREVTDGRAANLGKAGFAVLAPGLRTDGIMLALENIATLQCFRMWQQFGWPVDQFHVNFFYKGKDMTVSEERAVHHPV